MGISFQTAFYNDFNQQGVKDFLDHLIHQQDGATHGIASIIKGIIANSNSDKVILWGLTETQNGSDVDVSEGAAWVIDRVVKIDAQTVSNSTAGNIWIDAQKTTLAFNPITDSQGNTHDVNKINNGVATATQPGGSYNFLISNTQSINDFFIDQIELSQKADKINNIFVGSPTFYSGWGALPNDEPKFWVDQFKVVHLEGSVLGNVVSSGDIALSGLPPPAKNVFQIRPVIDQYTTGSVPVLYDFFTIAIYNNSGSGDLRQYFPNTGVSKCFSLDGITYRSA